MRNAFSVKCLLRFGVWASVWILAAGAAFYGLHLLSILVPAETVHRRVSEAFERQNLVPENYPRNRYGLSSNYTLIGLDQFTDGLVVQMALYRNPSRWRAAFVPKIAMPDTADSTVLKNEFPCQNALLIASGKARLGETASYAYTRYWWGQKVILSLLLVPFDFFQINNGLKALMYFSFACIGFLAAAYARPWFWPVFPFVAFGMLFSGIVYYGGLTDSTTFLGSLGMLIGLGIAQHRIRDEGRLALFFVVLGNVSAFLYSMRGGHMLFFSGAFVILYFIAFAQRPVLERYKGILFCFFAFLVGFAGSHAFRLLVSTLWMDPRSVFGDFLHQLKFRIGASFPGTDARPFQLVKRELFNFVYATYNSRGLSTFLIATAASAWVTAVASAVFRFLKRNDRTVLLNVAAVGMAAVVVAVRILVFRNHSAVHAWFIGRYMFIPLSLGWTALILALRKETV